MSDKPLEATQGRIDRARREGDVARSADLCAVSAFALGAGATGLTLSAMSAAAASALHAGARGEIATGAYVTLAQGAVCVLGAGLAGGVLGTVAQSGRVAFVAPKLRFDRLSPASGLRRMVSLQTFTAAAKAAVAALVAGSLLAPAIGDALAASATGATAARIVSLLNLELARIGGSLAAAGLFFGVIDLFVQRLSWRKRLRMSFAEFKDDQKQHEGDPLVRQRRRTSHRQLVRGSIERLRDAAFVVANPTHVAIALEYRPPEIEVPKVIVRAIDDGALEVRRRAEALGIPIVEDRPLARALLAQTTIDAYIPRELYAPVARIVAALGPLDT